MKLVGLSVRRRRHVDDTSTVRIASELTIEIGPALRIDLSFERPADVVIGTRPELLGDEMARPIANSLADIVARDHEVFAIVPDAAQDDMDVGMLGVL
jgi:hypothetical protein